MGRNVSYKANLEYVEVKKVACTSIKDALLRTDGEVASTGGQIHCHRQWDRVPRDWRAKHTFTFVRHPFDRLVSAYTEKLRGDIARMLKGNCPLSPDASFLEWVRWVTSKHPAHADGHWIPQTIVLKRRRAVAPETCYRFENIIVEWINLQHRFPPLVELPRHNVSRVDDPWQGYYCGESIDLAKKFYESDLREWGYKVPE